MAYEDYTKMMWRMFCLVVSGAILSGIGYCILGCDTKNEADTYLQFPESRIDLPETALTRFDKRTIQILLRYLAGNARWEVKHERGLVYAIRKELVKGEYEITSGGFYCTDTNLFGYNVFRCTGVILSFEKPYCACGNDRKIITSAKPGTQDLLVTVRPPRETEPGYSSYLIVDGGEVFLEIFDQAPEKERIFTKHAYAEVSAELADVLAHLDEIEKSGILPVPSRYAEPIQSTGSFEVRDTRTRGIYILHAFLNPRSTGIVYARVLDAKTGQRLSEDRLPRRSTRSIGWSEDGAKFFPYEAEITVYEGDWDTQYEAIFQLWHRDEQGHETKLAETRRMINGWER